MDLNYINEFLVLAETRYYVDAAEKLFVSTSTLTRHIQALENELGLILFDRTPRRVELTEQGRAFMPYAKQFKFVQDECNANLIIQTRREEKVVIGCAGHLTPYIAGDLIMNFKKHNPDFILEYIHVRPERQLEDLRGNRLDFLMVADEVLPKNEFYTKTCDIDSAALVVPPSHPMFGRESVTVQELAGTKLVVMSMLADERNSFMRKCKELGLYLDFDIINANNIIDLALVGGQAVVMPKKLAEFCSRTSFYGETVKAIIDIEPRMESHLAIAYRTSPALSKKEKYVLEYMMMHTRT